MKRRFSDDRLEGELMRPPRLRNDLREGMELKLSQMGEVSVPQFGKFLPFAYMGDTGESDDLGFPMVWVISYGGKLPATQSYEHSSRFFATMDGRPLFE